MKLMSARAGSNRFDGNQGIGINHIRTDSSWVGGFVKAGEVECIATGDLHGGEVQQGYAFQAVGGSIKIAFSCINTTRLAEEGISTAAVWGNEITLTSPEITMVDNLAFTAIRITGVSDAELYIVTR